jgi:DNA-directed RNA polymerase subunit RPC12/RpoP
MIKPDFIDFMVEGDHYFSFPNNFGSYECWGCGHIFAPGDRVERVEWVERARHMVRCPHCGREIEVF